MKKFIVVIFSFICMFCFYSNVHAIKFYEGDYISGEYISKEKDGKIYYLTMKFIQDSNGNVLYCMEPFVKFYETYDYSKSDNYNNLDSSTFRKVELLSYYGYGYKNRTSSKWYVITQYLIWRTVSSNDIYFTDKLNGKKITKYSDEINELLSDVSNHDLNNFNLNYDVDYDSSLKLNLDGYEVVSSDFDIQDGNISNIKDNGSISVRKKSNNYNNSRVIYDGDGSQDLLLRGNVTNSLYDIKINVFKGNIVLNIITDEIVSDYNVCYEIYSNDSVIDSVCTNSNLEYRSIDLSYGIYTVKQTYISNGYEIDSNIYEVNVDGLSRLDLSNKIIRGDLILYKYYCDELCIKEDNALFFIYDLNDKYIGEIVTDEYGIGSISLKYGEYKVKQISGMDGYDFVDDFIVNIDGTFDSYGFSLYNNKIFEDLYEIPNTGIY